jgi:hypothetical protein
VVTRHLEQSSHHEAVVFRVFDQQDGEWLGLLFHLRPRLCAQILPPHALQVIDFAVRLEYATIFCYHPALKRNTKGS